MNVMVQSLRELGPVKIGVMVLVTLALMTFFIFLTIRVSEPTLVPLYSDLTMEDSSKIVADLEEKGVDYKLIGNGSQILVPADDVLRLRLSLAQEGIPSQGSVLGYEVFDRSEALGTSNFVHNVNLLRALEGELARTISAFSGIKSARVHLVMPKRELFTRDRREPSASVAVQMDGGKQLSKKEVEAIRYLVATAIPKLKVSKITIVDFQGRLLARGVSDEDDPEAYAANAEEYERTFERRMRTMVEELVEKTVGFNKVKAQVSADIDFDRVVINSEIYDPDSQVARSVQTIEESENSVDKDLEENVTVQNQLPDANPVESGVLSQSTAQRSEETTNFEISKTIKNHIQETGTVNRLSVAVLVDGTYETTELEDGTVEVEYIPRSQEELDQIETLVKSAIGFEADRGDTVEVVNMPFTENMIKPEKEGPLDFLKRDFQGILETIVIGIVAILAILLIIRPLVNRALEATTMSEEEEEEIRAVMEGPALKTEGEMFEEEDESLIDIDRIEGGVKSASFRKINELVGKHPDETLNIMRQWMFEEK